MIKIWLPGGMAQTDTWDPKKYTPYRAGMKGSELLGTCKPIPTSADGIFLGKGMENIASVMHHGSILRSLSNETKFGAIHLKAQYYMMTGYLFPSGVSAPSMGAVVARTLGRRNPQVPPYIYIGRDIDTSDEEKLFISEYLGPGFYGVNYAPFMIPDPASGSVHSRRGRRHEDGPAGPPAGVFARDDRPDRARAATREQGARLHEGHGRREGDDGFAGETRFRLRQGREAGDAQGVRAGDGGQRPARYGLLLRQPVLARAAPGAPAGRVGRALHPGGISIRAVQGLRHAREWPPAHGGNEEAGGRAHRAAHPRPARARAARPHAGHASPRSLAAPLLRKPRPARNRTASPNGTPGKSS